MQERELTLSDGKAIIVRDDGKIFNLEHKEYFIQIDNAGYSYIIFGNKHYLIHRIVAKAFLPDYEERRTLQVHHIDFNRQNNALSNLVCMEIKDHQKLHKQKYSYTKICVVCGKEFTPLPTKRNRTKTCSPECTAIMVKKSAQKRCRKINQYSLDGTFIKTWGSAREAQNETGFFESNINKCCHNLIKYYKGYVWKYADREVE